MVDIILMTNFPLYSILVCPTLLRLITFTHWLCVLHCVYYEWWMKKIDILQTLWYTLHFFILQYQYGFAVGYCSALVYIGLWWYVHTHLCTRGRGKKLRTEVVSNPQSSMMVVDLNLRTLQGNVGWPDKQYWDREMHCDNCERQGKKTCVQYGGERERETQRSKTDVAISRRQHTKCVRAHHPSIFNFIKFVAW